jgi:tuftelin-interacting protein 11
MARRKRTFLEDDLDSSEGSDENDLDDQAFEDNDPDARAERSLFEDPYQRKKRRRVGGFDDDDDDALGGRTARKGKPMHFSQQWVHGVHYVCTCTDPCCRAPSFVTGEKKRMEQDETLEEPEEEDEEDEGDEEADEEADDESLAASPAPEPRIREDLEDERPQFGTGGLGSAARRFESASIFSRGGVGSGKGALGSSSTNQGTGQTDDTAHEAAVSSFSSRRGIGSKKGLGVFGNEDSVPGAIDAAPRHPQSSFLRNGSGSTSTPGLGTPKLSQEERLHFSKLQGSFGAKLMEKMGWQAVSWPLLILSLTDKSQGTGLGASGEGIVTPVETKLRPKPSMGLAFKGFKEKTAQSKAEARRWVMPMSASSPDHSVFRRGEIVSDNEDASSHKRGGKSKGTQKAQSDAWKKPRKAKVKVEHQTYEQIVQGVASHEAQATGIGKIYDATGGEVCFEIHLTIAQYLTTISDAWNILSLWNYFGILDAVDRFDADSRGAT